MFTFDSTPVKFVGLFIMFLFTTAWGLWELTRPAERRTRISGILHLWMSVVMLLMVSRGLWQPFVKVIPLPVLTATQALSAVWFLWQARRAGADRPLVRHHLGHAAMFGAMTWHLAAMGVKMPHMGPDMRAWVAQESAVGGALWTFALVGVPFMLWLLYAGIRSLAEAIAPAGASVLVRDGSAAPIAVGAGPAVRVEPAVEVAGCHAPRVVGTPQQRLGRLHDAAMNLGMFWMSTGLVVPLLPFMAALAF